MKLLLQYRDADNYKFNFSVTLSEEIINKIEKMLGKPIEVGDEINYDHDLGISRNYFHDYIIKYPYNQDTDHNIIEILEILNTDAVTSIDCD